MRSPHHRGIPAMLGAVFCLLWLGALPAVAQTPTPTPAAGQADKDIEEAIKATGATGASAAWLSDLRRFAVIIFMAAIVIAGLAYAAGSRKMAYAVVGGAFFVYAAYWALVIFVAPLDPTGVASRDPGLTAGDVAVATGQSQAAAVIRGILNSGLELLSIAVGPFLIVYGALLGLKSAYFGGLDEGEFSSFILGSVIIFGAGTLGSLINIIPPSFWS